MKRDRVYWRRFVGWATDYVSQIEHDPYLRAQLTFVVLLGLIGLITIIAMGLVIYLTLAETAAVLTEALPEESTVIEAAGTEALTALVFEDMIPLTFMVNAAIVLLGYLAARISFMRIAEVIEAQRNFIAYTAHELRTPLAIARLTLETSLLDHANTSLDEYTSTAQRAIEELDVVAATINNLVALNMITQSREAVFEPVDLTALTQECTEAMSVFAAQKGLHIYTHLSRPLWVAGNRDSLRQVVTNLLRNAIKYTDHGSITVGTLTVAPDRARVFVRDTGIGIAPDDLPHVCEPFFRSASSTHRSRQGSGLGLALVSRFVHQHRGRLRVKSLLGLGTTIMVDLHTSNPPPARTHPLRTIGSQTLTLTYSH